MIFYTTIAKLKDNSYINNNVDDEQLKIILQRVQTVYLDDILCKDLNKRLLEGISNSNLTAKETDLINNYLQPVVTVLCEIKATTMLKFQMRKKTVGTNKDEFIDSVNSTKLFDELNEEKSKLVNNMTRFIKENKADFPTYNCFVSEDFNINISFV